MAPSGLFIESLGILKRRISFLGPLKGSLPSSFYLIAGVTVFVAGTTGKPFLFP